MAEEMRVGRSIVGLSLCSRGDNAALSSADSFT